MCVLCTLPCIQSLVENFRRIIGGQNTTMHSRHHNLTIQAVTECTWQELAATIGTGPYSSCSIGNIILSCSMGSILHVQKKLLVCTQYSHCLDVSVLHSKNKLRKKMTAPILSVTSHKPPPGLQLIWQTTC
uniref:Uncharacterized protein n=1 Tax=Oryza brachyantha TaxID=4533 RepID=J3N269_ORYBR